MRIEVLGTGCMKCNKLYEAATAAVAQAGVAADVVKVTDLAAIAKRGVLVTPALVVDGEVRVSGRVPSAAELVKLLT